MAWVREDMVLGENAGAGAVALGPWWFVLLPSELLMGTVEWIRCAMRI
jgi:hypothetical protein